MSAVLIFMRGFPFFFGVSLMLFLFGVVFEMIFAGDSFLLLSVSLALFDGVAFVGDDGSLESKTIGQWLVTDCANQNSYFCTKPANLIPATVIPQYAGCPKGFTPYEYKCFKSL